MGALTLTLAACQPPAENTDSAMETQTETQTTTEDFTGGLNELMQRGRDAMCTFTRTDDTGTMEGTVYVARNGNMRGEFMLHMEEYGDMQMHMIRDGDFGYTWGFPSQTEGTKIALDDEMKPVDQNENEPSLDDPMEYRCTSWRADNRMFTPPSNVEFQDISAMMEQMMQQMPPM